MRRGFVPIACVLALSAADAAERVVPYEIVNAREIPTSLTGRPGNADAGRRLFFDRQRARCSICHGSPESSGDGAESRTDAAPSLTGVARRLSEGALRLWLVAPQVLAPGTAMPAYYALGQRDDPADPRYGEPLLSAAEIEDLIAYLTRPTDPR